MTSAPFQDHVCAKCAKPAEVLHFKEPRPVHLCWACYGKPTNWQERADHYRAEAKHMGASVRHAWAMVAVANKRLIAANLPRVNGPNEAA